ncbi:F-box domain [Cedratvirus A11]|uniref:F-box domain n=1 Tax=Cedratvirus A11 TaxID=1903266 RepID=A0A1M7XUK2_9VIRU|nr:F-box domain [Cedratvirus A11]SHO33351.1 F-box domain [Cedratvirus A11]
MCKLSLEVMFVIVESVEVDGLFVLSCVDREFRYACESENLWKRIFERHSLTMLEKGKNVGTWILNFRNSLASAKLAKDITNDIPTLKVDANIVPNINLNLVRDVSIIHLPGVTNKDKLEGLIMKNRSPTKVYSCIYCALRDISWDNMKWLQKKAIRLSYKLRLLKREESIFMSIGEFCHVHRKVYKEYFCCELTREQVCSLLYKLCYYSLIEAKSASSAGLNFI